MLRCATYRSWTGLVLLMAFPLGARAAAVPEPSGESALAWRLDSLSSATLGPNKAEPVWRQGAALLEAAGRLDPQQPRFPRLRTLALMHVGDSDGAIAALKAYRKLSPADRVAQVQLIEMYASKLETLDAKVNYLSQLLDKQDLAPEVRAQVAVLATVLLAQKSPELAGQMAARAVQLYPLPQATRQYYELVARHKPLKERVAALLAVLEADPAQPSYLTELASLLASNGLADASLPWYDLAVNVIMRSGPSRPPGFHDLLIDYTSDLIVAGHSAPADTMLGKMLDEAPLDPDAWFLKLTVDRTSSEQVAFSQTLELARTALVQRYNMVHDDILAGRSATQPSAPSASTAPGDQPATMPSDQTGAKVDALDPGPVVQKLKGGGNPQAEAIFEGVVGDLAWFELYYAKQPDAAAKWIDVLRGLLAPDSVMLQRLEGWHALVAGKPQQARKILSKVAGRDTLVDLGLIRADEAEKKPVDPATVRKLLDDHRIGLAAAVLWADLRSDATTPATQPAANELAAEVDKFPKDWLQVVDPTTAGRVYNVRGEPLQASVPFGAPVLALVTIDNRSDHDITVGSDALLRPDLWFDAQILGLDQQAFQGVAYDQVENEIVVHAHSSTSQIVRLDERALRQALQLSPGSSTRVSADVVTNPITIHDPSSNQGQIVPGPGGTVGNFSRTFVYTGIPLTLQLGKKKIDEALASNSVTQKLQVLDLLDAYVRLAQRPDVDEGVQKAAAELPATIARLRRDSSPLVGAWASYLSASLTTGRQQDKIVAEMAASSDWTTRLLSLFAGSSLPASRQMELASTLARNDSDPTVKAAAAATVDLLQQATTQPSTQPSTESSTEPAAPATEPAGPPLLPTGP